MAIQNYLNRPLLIENVSSYFSYQVDELTEYEFLNTVAEAADCYILLDVNNVYVSSVNHGFNAQDYFSGINPQRVKQIHLAGYENCGDYLLDSHGCSVKHPVWELYKKALEYFGPIPTLIEWDNDMPEFSELNKQALKAQQLMDKHNAELTTVTN